MPFDPSLPLDNTSAKAAIMRAQFLGLKAIIDGITPLSAAQVDAVNTLPPGSNATVDVSVSGNTLHFTFALPQGNDGGPGPQGPPFAGAAVNSVNPSDPASVVTSFDGSKVHFTFDIPRGQDRADGINGEVSNADLETAINGTGTNSNGVATLDTPFVNDPPTLADMETMRAAYNAIVLAARR